MEKVGVNVLGIRRLNFALEVIYPRFFSKVKLSPGRSSTSCRRRYDEIPRIRRGPSERIHRRLQVQLNRCVNCTTTIDWIKTAQTASQIPTMTKADSQFGPRFTSGCNNAESIIFRIKVSKTAHLKTVPPSSFLPRDASGRPSVTLVDCDHLGWNYTPPK